MKLEIVNHCWRYSRLLRYQLSSLLLHPPQEVDVVYTLFYSTEDVATSEVVAWFDQQSTTNVRWNWRELSTPQLLRRAIGRNLAAQATAADWVWFTDADHSFGSGCLDALPEQLSQVAGPLAFPRHLYIHIEHRLGDLLIDAASGPLQLLDVGARSDFKRRRNNRAIGGIQITRGDVCRANGYCAKHRRLQRPIEGKVFANCYGDRVFRRGLGTPGEPIDVPNLFRIRHSERGEDSPGLEL